MALITKVKVSNIDNLTEARYFAGAQVDWLEFCLDDESDRCVTPMTVHDIAQWITGPALVGEMGNYTTSKMHEVAEALELDFLKIPLTSLKGDMAAVQYPLIGNLPVNKKTDVAGIQKILNNWKATVRYFEITLPSVDSTDNLPFSISSLKSLTNEYPIILNMSWTKARIRPIIEEWKPAGINIEAAGEEETGLKSFDEVADLLDQLGAET